ncbi:MAG TPA: ABC transporter substrate-binding protein, partial [Anaerolineae bacterium]|nr:ABC transporter substrate-binding protein [Anaerolineae bacterium]
MEKVTRREFLRLSSVAAAGVAIAACAKTAEPTTAPEAKATATTKPAEGKPAATAVPAATWPRGQVPRNRTLIRAYPGGTEFGNVGIANTYAGASHQHTFAASLEPMFYYAALNDKTYNHIAESYEYNDDATELTIYLRKGVEWSDGEPFTADDIAFTYNTLLERAPDYANSARVAVLLQEAVAVDDYTVRFMLKQANYRFHFTECTYRFDIGNYIVPEHVFKDVADWREFAFLTEDLSLPVVTGPYKISESTSTHKHFDLRDDWWAAKTGFMELPKVERIINITSPGDTQTAQMIINNEIDHCLDLRPRTIESILIQAPHVTTYSGRNKPYGYVDWWPISLHINNSEWPFQDSRVRWAMAYAIDQEQIVEVGWNGAGRTSYHPFPEYPGIMKYLEYCADIVAEYNPLEVDLQKSADLMVEAGFEKDSEGFWVKDGKRPDCNIYGDPQLFGDIAPIAAEQLHNAGFQSSHLTPPDVWDVSQNGSALCSLFGHGGSVKDPFTTLDMYHSKFVKPTGEMTGWINMERFSDPGYDAAVDELGQTSPDLQPDKCLELFRTAF